MSGSAVNVAMSGVVVYRPADQVMSVGVIGDVLADAVVVSGAGDPVAAVVDSAGATAAAGVTASDAADAVDVPLALVAVAVNV